MIGMGGGGEPEDPLLAILRVLGDQETFQRKYNDLLTQTITAKQTTENAIKERTAADVVIAQAAVASAELATARAAFDEMMAEAKTVISQRENDVRRRESNCTERENVLTIRESALANATIKANAEHDARCKSLNAKTTEHNNLLDRRKTSLDATEAQNQKKLDVRAAQLAEREDAAQQLHRDAAAAKLCYEQKIAALRAAVGS